MSAGAQESRLVRSWKSYRALIMEEISMISASMFNMLDFRSMLGHRRQSHHLSPDEYHKTGNAFGCIPIALYLGDFLQLRPTGQLSLVANLEEKDDDGNNVYNDALLEVARAQNLFGRAHDVFELPKTMRFVPGDPLVELLQRTRAGLPFPEEVWTAFQLWHVDSLEHAYLYDESSSHRGCCSFPGASCDVAARGRVMTMDTDATRRFLNIANPHNTGYTHGIFPCHVGMEIRFLAKVGGKKGLAQDTILDFEFHEQDKEEHKRAGAGKPFSPRYLPSGLYLSIRGYQGNEHWRDSMQILEERGSPTDELESLTRSLFFMAPFESTLTCFKDLLLLRPPGRQFLERGPASIRGCLQVFSNRNNVWQRAAWKLLKNASGA